LHIQAHFAGDDSTHIEQILDNLGLNTGISFDDAEPLLEFLALDISKSEDIRPSHHSV
jgi:hypothetical protein